MSWEQVVGAFLIALCIFMFLFFFRKTNSTHSSAEHSKAAILICLVGLLLFAFSLFFGAIDFTGLPVFDGYGFTI